MEQKSDRKQHQHSWVQCECLRTERRLKRLESRKVGRPTFAVEDDVLLRRTDVCVDVQAVSIVQLAGQTSTWEESHRFHAAETRF